MLECVLAFDATNGQVAQLVEQGTENPRAEGSSPPLTTMNFRKAPLKGAFLVSESYSGDLNPVKAQMPSGHLCEEHASEASDGCLEKGVLTQVNTPFKPASARGVRQFKPASARGVRRFRTASVRDVRKGFPPARVSKGTTTRWRCRS